VILLLDNRDSFTFNLEHALQTLGAEVRTLRSTELDAQQVLALESCGILIGPGPGTPAGAGCVEALVQLLFDPERPPVPTLGVCLGHQALATATGGRLIRARDLLHGQTRAVDHDAQGLFAGLPNPLHFTGYNSLVVDESSLAQEWQVSARNAAGEIEAMRHRSRPLFGVQAHPESILALESGGLDLLRAFVERCTRKGT
jgi:anthranilate synthase/aminodeoxychorismate synthase-like glutamine amidotransferase